MIDLSAPEFWAAGPADRDAAFATLRRERPVSWQGPPPSGMPLEYQWTTGYWALVRHAEVQAVSRDARLFRSAEGVMFEGGHPELLAASQSILGMDPPEHTRMRRLISAAFTPRRVGMIEGRIRANAHRVIAGLEPGEEFDFVERVASTMPLATICDMMGVAEGDRPVVGGLIEVMFGLTDPFVAGDRTPMQALAHAIGGLAEVAADTAAQRRRRPRDDVMTALVQAELDGRGLDDAEIQAFFVLLVVAGYETTRRTTTETVRALTEFRDQRRLLLADLEGRIEGAVEESIRWASPVSAFCRTATADTALAGQEIKAGDRVALFYRSANRDETVFDHPDRFDILRSPNPHVAFGGGGPHHCLGANVARVQVRALVTELLTRAPDFEVGAAQVLSDLNLNPTDRNRRVTRMPCTL
ncbi:cytochrome P450 [Actinomadura terrae]|uniref:cytochrome P450 n=1 Tax=Actinomadura terrae TaxID=604353 RepID=UPI001FA7692C|nr:cytochrome P450 [Actinomadura terrae]